MSFEKAKNHLTEYNLQSKVMQFEVSSATVKEAAVAVGCKEAEIAKTLSFVIGESPILIVVAGDCKIDNGKYKARCSTKATMIAFEDAERLVGHAVGGVCPFGINDGVKVYLDSSLKRFQKVYPACGSSNSAVEMTLSQLEQASRFEEWIDVCKIAL